MWGVLISNVLKVTLQSNIASSYIVDIMDTHLAGEWGEKKQKQNACAIMWLYLKLEVKFPVLALTEFKYGTAHSWQLKTMISYEAQKVALVDGKHADAVKKCEK